jgi:transposase
MFIRAKKKDENKWQVMIVESIRDGGSVSQKIVRNIGLAHGAEELKKFQAIGEAAIVAIKNARQPVLAFADPNEVYKPARKRKPVDDQALVKNVCEDARIIEGPEDIFGEVFDEINLSGIFDDEFAAPSEWSDTLKDVVLARIADPLSKLATSKYIEKNFGKEIPVHKIYRMLDRLADADERVKMAIAGHTKKVVGDKVDVLFFDVTTLYFESIEQDELRRFGFSKDCKFKETQVVLALITTTDGLPLAYDLFPGNTFEGHTLLPMIKKFKSKYLVNDILLVADRGMFSKDNLAEMENEGVSYIVAAKLKGMKKDVKESILQSLEAIKPNEPSKDFTWTDDRDHEGRRLIISYSEKRAQKDRADRKRLLDRVVKLEKDGKVATSDLINNSGTKKFLKVKSGFATIDYEKIEKDSRWDGLHGVITNLSREESSEAIILDRYRGLWQIEESFRINKHSLKMRPIYHWSPRRIRAHISLCFMAYAVLRHTQYRIKSKGVSLGVDVIRAEMNAVQSSLVIDQTTGKRYGIPSKMTYVAKQIYAAFGKMRDPKPYQV